MPHTISTYYALSARHEATQPAPFGPNFSKEIADRTETLRVVGSSFGDPGGDWTEFQAFDASGARIATRRIAGY